MTKTMTIREEAKETALDGFCGSCSAVGCNSHDICDGYQDEVKRLMLELACDEEIEEACYWTKAYNSRDTFEAANGPVDLYGDVE